MVESFEDVGAPLAADSRPAAAAEPGPGAFDRPAMPPRALAALDAAPGDTVTDPSLAHRTMTARRVAGCITVELARTMAGSAPVLANRRHGIDQFLEDTAVVGLGRGDPEGKRDARGVGDERALGPGSAAIARMGAGLFAPLLAGTEALSMPARLPSIACARPRGSSRTRCNRFQMPAARQSRRRRQQVMPDPRPLSRGSIAQGMPSPRGCRSSAQTVRRRRPTALWSRPLRWRQRFDNGPQFIGRKRPGHAPQNSPPAPPFLVLLRVLTLQLRF
jgi:hypothetical protein